MVEKGTLHVRRFFIFEMFKPLNFFRKSFKLYKEYNQKERSHFFLYLRYQSPHNPKFSPQKKWAGKKWSTILMGILWWMIRLPINGDNWRRLIKEQGLKKIPLVILYEATMVARLQLYQWKWLPKGNSPNGILRGIRPIFLKEDIGFHYGKMAR